MEFFSAKIKARYFSRIFTVNFISDRQICNKIFVRLTLRLSKNSSLKRKNLILELTFVTLNILLYILAYLDGMQLQV